MCGFYHEENMGAAWPRELQAPFTFVRAEADNALVHVLQLLLYDVGIVSGKMPGRCSIGSWKYCLPTLTAAGR